MEPDVLPDALAVPVTLTGIEGTDQAGYLDWLVTEFDVDSQGAARVLPTELLGMVVATAEGWRGRVWTGATLLQKQQLLDHLCAHGALGDLRGEVGDWWWFPLQPVVSPPSKPHPDYYADPQARVLERVTAQILANQTPLELLSGEGLPHLQQTAQKLKLSIPQVLAWCAQHTTQPMWIEYPEGWWANPPAQELGVTPAKTPGIQTIATRQGQYAFQYFQLAELGVVVTRPTLGLRGVQSSHLKDWLSVATHLDWITTDITTTLQTVLPFLERLQARIVVCLAGPAELEGFFGQLTQTLDDLSAETRQILAQARQQGQLQLRLGVGLSPRYQIALLRDTEGDGVYYYAALSQTVRTMGSWEGDIKEYQRKFESLWQTAADNRIQLIDLADLLSQYQC